MILFVAGTGTSVGKTAVTRGLAAGLRATGIEAVALKPLETGCDPDPLDALALARASGAASASLAAHPSFYRVAPPLAPYAATLAGQPPPDFDAIVSACRALAANVRLLIVEGAGGLLVPLDPRRTTAELAGALGAELLIVAPDRLGVLSDTLAIVEAANARALPIAAVVLNRGAASADPSRASNQRILAERCTAPVIAFESCPDEDRALAAEAARCGLLATVTSRLSR